MNCHARCVIYLRRFWTRWDAPDANRPALLLEAASPDWEQIDWKSREQARRAFEANYGDLLPEIDENDSCGLCQRDNWAIKHHIVPLEWGGINADDNLIPLCHACHTFVHPWMSAPVAKDNAIRMKNNGRLDV
jgi:HNH endonuclease